jgi:putative transposase
LQAVYFRLGKAMDAFFRRVKAGEKPGFPRVKPRHAFFTLCYPACYIQIEGNCVILPTGGCGKSKKYPDLRARLTETPPEGYHEVAISRDGRGHYHASFVYEQQTPEPAKAASVVAFDLGITTLATGVNEQGRVSEKKRNKQRDSLHKASHLISHKLVERTVVVGDLSQRQMVMREHQEKNRHRNRAVYNDWGLYTFLQMLAYKCQLSGKNFQIISERDTSKMCSACGNLMPMPLWKRTYHCEKENCGLKMDRDENSARNILKRFLAGPRPHTDDSVRCADVFTATEYVGTQKRRQVCAWSTA